MKQLELTEKAGRMVIRTDLSIVKAINQSAQSQDKSINLLVTEIFQKYLNEQSKQGGQD